jgi:hypothetical protein
LVDANHSFLERKKTPRVRFFSEQLTHLVHARWRRRRTARANMPQQLTFLRLL